MCVQSANIKVVRVTLAFLDRLQIATKNTCLVGFCAFFYFPGAEPCCGNSKARTYGGKENNIYLLAMELYRFFK